MPIPSKYHTLSALLLAFVSLFLLEIVVRTFFSDMLSGWEYWDPTAANKYETYFQLKESGVPPSILVVGDSSADYGFYPAIFNEATNCDKCAFNLATLGNFPISFDQTINDVILNSSTPHPEYLFIIFTRDGFDKKETLRISESSILNAPFVKRRHNQTTIGDWMYLTRIWRSRSQILNILKGKPPIDQNRGYIARERKPKKTTKKPKNSKAYQLDQQRFNVLKRTLQLCKSKNIQPIVIHPPVHTYESLMWNNPEVYTTAVADLCQRQNVPFWDFTKDTVEYEGKMLDLVHLNKEGAIFFSKEVALKFKDLKNAATFLNNHATREKNIK